MVIIWSKIYIKVYKHTYYLETVLGVFKENHVLESKITVFEKQNGSAHVKSDIEVLDDPCFLFVLSYVQS